jgi:hypothetical protein
MHELILHHYDISPYAEKIRAILGFNAYSDEAERLVRVKPNTQSERSRTPRPSEGEQPDRSPVTGASLRG